MDGSQHRAQKRARLEDAQARAERAERRAEAARREASEAPSPAAAAMHRREQAVHEQTERLHLAAADFQEEHLQHEDEKGDADREGHAGGHDGPGA